MIGRCPQRRELAKLTEDLNLTKCPDHIKPTTWEMAMKFMDGATYREIGAEYGINHTSVMGRVTTVLRVLRRGEESQSEKSICRACLKRRVLVVDPNDDVVS
jgi:DNA-directed RNA polymerase specialized sigma24 family protein